MDPKLYADKLNRAAELEEVMSAKLIELMQPELLEGSITPVQRERIIPILESIQKDTQRHKSFISGLLAKKGAGR